MLQEKRKDLDSEKQKKLLQRMVAELSHLYPDLYYQPTSEVADLIRRHVASEAKLNAEEHALLKALSKRDIEVLLSLH
ncbi:hypothetical protein J7382_18095 [Shimia sp. R11_0]|uniref:hypothetical protein n=1 Tax=Shimia sp. R11_0 TaxID=2821096 RepID=UPI001ADB638E|nr:hypothetical protein [Shimia sp. R11_0]MBO9479461.1 hypothetical protein [Shimia sp. R11_0]